MRREWKFALQFVHQAGQLLIQCSPQWEYEFIDLDRTAVGLAQRERLPTQAESSPMFAVLSYTDRAAVVQSPPQPVTAAGGSQGAGVSLRRPSTSRGSLSASPATANIGYQHAEEHAFTSSREVGKPAETAPAVADDRVDGDAWWVEKSKAVELFYCLPAPGMDLKGFCKHCVQFVLRDPHVASIDGDTRLARLHIGDKLRCTYQLGGRHRSFQLRYTLHDRSELQESHVYAIGTIVGQRGYLLRARCTDAEELEGYVRKVLLPVYTSPGRVQFGVDVTYHDVSPTTPLSEQQEAFGQLQYVDHKAAIVFVTPLYPMRVLPDYSPAKTVGVGSITCLTLKLSVHERLLDDIAAAEITGVAKYKVSPIIACVEVEEVSRMGYPKVMSTEQYSELKAARVAEVFPDAKMVGLPSNLFMGSRTGRLRTMTFTYEPLGCVVKALIASTLVGNLGVTALYIAKFSGGVFDAHLYVFQQLVRGMGYLPQNNAEKSARVSRYRARNIRLMEEDVIHAYSDDKQLGDAVPQPVQGATPGSPSSLSTAAATPHPTMLAARDPRIVAATRERHLHFLSLGNDGRVEGGVEAVVSPEEGGIAPTRRSVSAANNEGGLHAHGGCGGGSEAEGASAFGTEAAQTSLISASLLTASLASDALVTASLPASALVPTDEAFSAPGGGILDALHADFSSSADSSSRISVTNISHLRGSGSASLAGDHSDADDAMSGFMEDGHDAFACSHEEASASVGPSAASLAGSHPRASVTENGDGIEACTSIYRQRGSGSILAVSCISSAAADAGAGEVLKTQVVCSGSALPTSELPDVSGDGDAVGRSPDVAARLGTTTCPSVVDNADTAAAEQLKQRQLYEQLVGKGDPVVQQALREAEGGTLYGPSLRDVYARCCEAQQCRPNSYLMRKLPVQPEFTYSVEEIDLSANYVGHNGFVAVLHLLEHLPRLRVVYFNNMSLDNMDAESLCYALATNHTVREVHLEHNPGISLPSMRHFTALLRVNRRIEVLMLAGTRLSPTLIAKLQEEACQPRD
ncbi:conserved hypothetical protein [Leishmania major strain Friedlin]|uniref:Uncharacterized protein n=1 Tax=Leishmania major TaxID=5664 RepID=Q4QIR2_LEIMA|nr:conserved hypothetical protein [Leishmania major strain Friedlin]CAG9568966.1 hypothetical_protein_-_conserved [Leishmania major strain Friedlin]CAJ06991.1 conserved hypothetical protein [Leishmania major strain Friedlin]|eukprot:XP_001680936.1 conserved hypothetical protein [Leishmania major strain Friedlin]